MDRWAPSKNVPRAQIARWVGSAPNVSLLTSAKGNERRQRLSRVAMEWTWHWRNECPESARAVPVRVPQETQEATPETLLDSAFRTLIPTRMVVVPKGAAPFHQAALRGRTAVMRGDSRNADDFAGRCSTARARDRPPLPTSTDPMVPIPS